MNLAMMGSLMMVLFWLALLVFGGWLLQTLGRGIPQQQAAPRFDTLLAITRRRYARGAISLEEYLALLDTLRQDLAE